jgi:hypothetical protein
VTAADGPGPCPECGTEQARSVVYGYPAFDDVEHLGAEVVFAGCLIPPDPRAWACGHCGTHYGERVRFGADGDD